MNNALPAHILAALNGQLSAVNTVTIAAPNKRATDAQRDNEGDAIELTTGIIECPELEVHSIEGDNQIWDAD